MKGQADVCNTVAALISSGALVSLGHSKRNEVWSKYCKDIAILLWLLLHIAGKMDLRNIPMKQIFDADEMVVCKDDVFVKMLA